MQHNIDQDLYYIHVQMFIAVCTCKVYYAHIYVIVLSVERSARSKGTELATSILITQLLISNNIFQ